jgi:DNA-directed RNA polymerase specialized sigma subunit
MTAKEYLSQVYWLNRIINNKIEQKEELEALAERTTIDPTKEKVIGGRQSTSPMEDATVKLIDLSHEINDDIDELIKLREEVEETIEEVEDYRYRTILEMRYLKGKPWKDVSSDIGFDKRWVMRLHSRALKEVDEILILTTKSHL